MDYAELLCRHDDPKRWDQPAGFDYVAASARFSRFMTELTRQLGNVPRAETGSHIQDASFHSQVYLEWDDGQASLIRFSNFGDMVTVSNEALVPQPLMRSILELFRQHGYTYVPERVLEKPYGGQNPGVTGIRTWWVRYFDWV